MEECSVCGVQVPEFLIEKHKARHKGKGVERTEKKEEVTDMLPQCDPQTPP